MTPRAITLTLSEEFLNLNAKNDLETFKAIGYLATWAYPNQTEERHCKLDLYGDREGNFQASYKDKDGKQTYFLFGLRRDDGTYSFHS